MDVSLPTFPMPPYEFMAFLRYEDLDKDEVKLGVMLDEQDGRVVITGVAPGSNAERAGLQKGDALVSIDGETINDTFDLVYAIKKKNPGDHGKVVVDREEKPLEYDVEFLKQEQAHHIKQ